MVGAAAEPATVAGYGRPWPDVPAACSAQRRADLGHRQSRRPARIRCPAEELQGVRGSQVLEDDQGGGEELPQRTTQSQHLPGPILDQRLVRASHQLDRLGQGADPPAATTAILPQQADQSPLDEYVSRTDAYRTIRSLGMTPSSVRDGTEAFVEASQGKILSRGWHGNG